jgi:hypothetical protein
VYEEGEDAQNSAFDDSDDDDELESQTSSRDTTTNKDEWKFAITDQLKICRYDKSDGSVGISWQDLNGDLGDEFEFVVDVTCKQPQIDSFVLALYKCLYEQRYQQSSIGVSDGELLKEFSIDPKRRHQMMPYDDLEKSINLLPQETGEGFEYEDELVGTTKVGSELSGAAKVVYHNSSFSLHSFDPQTDMFRTRLEVGKADLKVYDVGDWVYTIIIQEIGPDSLSRVHISQGVSETINPTFNYEYQSFVFNHFTVDNSLKLQGSSWLVKFVDIDELLKFQIEFMRVMWQSLHKQEYSVSKPDEEYLANAMRDMDIDDEEEEPEREDDDEDEYNYKVADGEQDQDIDELIESRIRGRSKTIAYSDDEYDDEDDDKRNNAFQAPAETNNGLSVGTTNDLSFVVRGNKIGVFDTDSKLNFKTSINNLKDLKGQRFVPKTTLLHQQDQFMVMSNKSHNDKSLYKMDLNRGEIIEEWKIDDDYPLVSFAPNSKYSQLTNEQTLTGIHADGLFRIDPRLSGNKLVKDNTYKLNRTRNNKFLTLATTEKGYIAVGSEKGDIRLYDRLGVNAKSALPSIGDPIVGIDVSSDGRWLLATCKTYLLLIDVLIGSENKNAGSLGFEKYFDKDKKPKPIRLAIKPEHARYIIESTGKAISFTVAHFNTGINTKESSIVTSCGPYIISWSLRQIMQGKTRSYTVKEYQAPIVADNFKYGSDSDVIYASTNDVRMLSRKRMVSANRALKGSSVVKKYE